MEGVTAYSPTDEPDHRTAHAVRVEQTVTFKL